MSVALYSDVGSCMTSMSDFSDLDFLSEFVHVCYLVYCYYTCLSREGGDDSS